MKHEIKAKRAEHYPRFEMACDPDSKIKVLTNACCGVKELTGLKGSYQNKSLEKDLLNVARIVKGICVFVLFAGVEGDEEARIDWDQIYPPYAPTFSSLIQKKGLGTVFKSEVRKNPNSGNDISVYLWTLNKEALDAWVKEEDEKEEAKESLDLKLKGEVSTSKEKVK